MSDKAIRSRAYPDYFSSKLENYISLYPPGPPSLVPRACCPCLHSMSFLAGPVHRYVSPCSLPRVQISLAAPSSQAWIRLSATSTHRDEAYAMSLGAHLCGPPTWASTMPVATRSKAEAQNRAQGGTQENAQAKK